MARRTHADYLNMIHSEAQSHYRTQKMIVRSQLSQHPTLNAFKTFISVNILGWIYHYLKSRVGSKHPFMDYSRSAGNGVFTMRSASSPGNDHIKMVLAADWATDTAESDHIAALMKKEESDYSIHLGDTYFVGDPDEIKCNFLVENAPWPRGSSGTLAIPGNHEFYSNGGPYFDQLLPHMFVRTENNGTLTQDASFFCLQNDYWRVIGLDNGYYSVGKLIIEFIIRPDAHLDPKLIDWLKKEVATDPNDNRGLIILSHIQYCSAFEPQFPKAAEALREIFGPKKEVIWLWGHEHRFSVYGRYQSEKGIAAYGRCIGHGGMPVEIGKVRQGEEMVKGPDPKKMKGCELVFFDNRKKGIIGDTILGHNGYTLLTLNANKLILEYKDELTWLFREEWELDRSTGKLCARVWNNPAIPLTLVANSYSAAVPPPCPSPPQPSAPPQILPP